MDDAFRVAENSDAGLIADEVAADAKRLAEVIRRAVIVVQYVKADT